MGVEWLAELWAKTASGAVGAEIPECSDGRRRFNASKGSAAWVLTRETEIRRGGGQSFAAELAGPDS